MRTKRTYTLVNSRSIFSVSLVVVTLTILAVYFLGLGSHHTFYENGMLSTTLLSFAFFLFITIGLFRGIKLRDDVGTITEHIKPIQLPDAPDLGSGKSFDFLDFGGDEGCFGFIIALVAWVVAAIVICLALWIFGQVVWMLIIVFVAMLYWIFFRALRLIFKNSNKSKGDLFQSIRLGVFYTILYNFWIYGIFLIAHYSNFG